MNDDARGRSFYDDLLPGDLHRLRSARGAAAAVQSMEQFPRLCGGDRSEQESRPRRELQQARCARHNFVSVHEMKGYIGACPRHGSSIEIVLLLALS
jgi:hypothetical protein